ncbi:MAG: nuclear transport factor 2 family protein [Gammaproteobacteria bacterium]|nr:nuclear transport factor 2 family protein [Gammaproteobacteria bacterium]
MKNQRLLFVYLALILLLAGCQAGNNAAYVANQGLVSTDQAFSELSAREGVVAAFRRYATNDSLLLPENQAAISGKAAILSTLKAMPAGSSLTWNPQAADVSGSLGYSWGIYTLTGKDSAGQTTVAYGKYLSVWKRRAGEWWLAAMMVNSTPGPAGG